MKMDGLPPDFYDLEPWLEWSLSTEHERCAKRYGSRIEDIKDFYDAMMKRMEDILNYLENCSPEKAQPSTNRLLYLTLSLAEIAPAVELYGQPAVVDGFDVFRFAPGSE